jgi:hypothetical protein
MLGADAFPFSTGSESGSQRSASVAQLCSFIFIDKDYRTNRLPSSLFIIPDPTGTDADTGYTHVTHAHKCIYVHVYPLFIIFIRRENCQCRYTSCVCVCVCVCVHAKAHASCQRIEIPTATFLSLDILLLFFIFVSRMLCLLGVAAASMI